MAGAHDHTPAGRVPFWIHQLVELLLGGLLLIEGARTGQHTAVLVSLGVLLVLLALCSDGALGGWALIGRRLHRVLDLVAAAVLALSPVFLGLDHALAIVILEVAAVAMVWLALRTEWRKKSKPKPKPRPQPAAAPDAPLPLTASATPVARKLGSAVGKARDDGPRQLGRLVGRAQRAAKAAMKPETPPTSSTERPPQPPEAPEAPDAPPSE
jgi:uncharacterized membrane protein YhaH (DUF805 family)